MPRRIRLLSFIFLWLSAITPPAWAANSGDTDDTTSKHADRVIKVPTPAWVNQNPIDPTTKPPKNGSSGGIWYLCAEQQVHIEKGSDFGHYAYRFLNPAGLDEKAQLSLNFDPAYQTLNLHSLIIHRDGKPLDRLAESKIRLIQREDGHEQQLYDGSLTALIILKDIRVGDILDYSYSIVGKNPIFDGHYCSFQKLGFTVPVHHLYYRYIWNPKERTLRHKLFNIKKKATVSKPNELKELVWEKKKSPPVIRDADTPSWHLSSPMIQVSDYKSWEDFGNWANPIYVIGDTLPAPLKKVCDDIKKLPDDSQRIMATLAYVQDTIRYLGSFMGKHSHQPYSVDTICERRFGDCKDKSILLSTMLQYLGYDAVPALVNTDERGTIDEYLAGHFDFDHLIVCLRHDGETYWLDGTRSYQRGHLSKVFIPDYGRAFVLDGKNTSLTKLKPRGHGAKETVIAEHFDFPDFSGAIDFTVTTTAKGADADYWRYRIATNSKKELTKDFLEYHSKSYPEITSKADIVFADDPTKNVIVINRSYTISNFWEADDDNANDLSGLIHARSSYNKIDYPSSPLRTMPYEVYHPVNLYHTVRIDFPIDSDFSEISEKIENDTFKFIASSNVEDSRITLHYRYRSKSDHVTPEALKSYLAECDTAEDSTYYWLYYDKSSSAGSTGEETGALSTILILSIMCGVGLGSLLAAIAYFYDPKPRALAEPSHLYGLSGWLILIAIRVCLDPLLSFGAFTDTEEFFSGTSLRELLDDGYGKIAIAWFISLSTTAFLIPFSILMIVLFFGKRTSFPRFYIAYMVGSFLMEVIVFMLIRDVNGVEQYDLDESARDLTIMGISVALWVPYMLLSKRVRNTFTVTRRIEPTIAPPTPSPPEPDAPVHVPVAPPELPAPPKLTAPPADPDQQARLGQS